MKAVPVSRGGGFSLIELLVALAIAGILASVALPTYGAYVARVRRVAARVALTQAAHWLERAATASGRYPKQNAVPQGLLKVEGGHYRLAVTIDSEGTKFSLEATPQGVQTNDRCGTLVLSHTGQREILNVPDATAVNADTCWSR